MDIGEYTKQIVYSPHDYGPEVHNQSWFYLTDDTKTFDRQSLLDDYWYDSWAYLVEEGRYPLLMGEWGGWVDEEHDKTGENVHWMQELRDYMIDKRIHHTFWCFNENSSDTGGLVYDNFQKWDDVKYDFIKSALWQTDSGKFISLDHKIPLGTAGNGISLGDFVSSGEGSNMAGGKSSGPSVPKTTTSTTKPAETTTTTTSATTTTKHETTTTTTTATTTAPKQETTTTTIPVKSADITLGDANCDGTVDMSDVVLVMQSLANPDKYGLTGSDKNHITNIGWNNADIPLTSKGVTTDDALAIQEYLLGKRKLEA